MKQKIQNLLNKLEDPEKTLLGPNVKWLKIWGLWLPTNKTYKRLHITCNTVLVIFFFTQYIDICLARSDLGKLIQNVKYSIVSTVNMSKAFSFFVWNDYWKSIMKYVTEEDLERRKTKDKKSRAIVSEYTKYCRKMTYFYWFLLYSTVVLILIQTLIQYIILRKHDPHSTNYVHIVPSWLPIDTDSLYGYIILITYQIYALVCAVGWITSFDANAVGITIFFKGQLELIRRDSKYLFGTEENPRTKEEAKKKLVECYRRHNEFMKYFRLFDSCLSPIMFLYVIVCSIMLCATLYQIASEKSILQKLLTAEYLIFGISQLFMYCWHSNEILCVSKDLSLGPYESIWWKRDVSEQIDIKILTEQFSKAIAFSAGPFTVVTVPTFLSILKGSYSYYTLLRQSQQS